MSKLDVIKVEWTSDTEVHIYPPAGGDAWWARPVQKYVGEGEVWELHDGSGDDEAEGYFPTIEQAIEYVSESFDNAPVIVTKERDQ